MPRPWSSDGYVYFGTATDPTFYKLAPDGTVRWSYRNPLREKERARIERSQDPRSSKDPVPVVGEWDHGLGAGH